MAGMKAGLGQFVISAISAPYRKFKAWRQRCHTLHQLRRLNDHQLKDIGLTKHDIDRFY